MLVSSLLVVPSFCLAGPGTNTAEFLQIGLGARATGMGGAFTGLSDDASAIYWNPSGLSQLLRQEVSFLHTQWIDDITYEYGLYAYPSERLGTFGTSFAILQKNGIPGLDENGNSIGSVSAQSSVYSLAWGKSFMGSAFSLGSGLKFIQEDFAGYSANSYAADVGALAPIYQDPRFRLTAGAAVRNLGNQGTFVAQGGNLPRTIALGVGLKAFEDKLSFDFDKIFPQGENSGQFAVGAEYWVHPMIAVRAGYNSTPDTGSGFSAGVGFRVQDFQFDYAFSDLGVLGFSNRGGISWRFGRQWERLYDEGVDLMRRGDYAEAFLKFNKLLTQRPDDARLIARMKECYAHIQERLKFLEPVAPQAPRQ